MGPIRRLLLHRCSEYALIRGAGRIGTGNLADGDVLEWVEVYRPGTLKSGTQFVAAGGRKDMQHLLRGHRATVATRPQLFPEYFTLDALADRQHSHRRERIGQQNNRCAAKLKERARVAKPLIKQSLPYIEHMLRSGKHYYDQL